MIYNFIHSTAFSNVGFAINASKIGKMSVPVSSSNYMYAHFKHVMGTPAPEGIKGVTINSLKILDVLIEQASHLKTQKETINHPVSNDQMNALIEQYEHEIRQTMQKAAALPYSPAPIAPVGAIFDLVA